MTAVSALLNASSALLDPRNGTGPCCVVELFDEYEEEEKNPRSFCQVCWIVSDVEGFERAYLGEIYAMLASIGALTLFAVLANGFILFILFRDSALRRMKNIHFFIMIALSLLNAVIYYFYIVLTYQSDFDLLDCVCKYFYGGSSEIIYNLSLTVMLAMTIERLISVVMPLWYATFWIEERYSIYLLSGMVLLGALPTALPLLVGSVTYSHSRKWMYCRLAGTRESLMAYIWTQNCVVYIPTILGVVVVYIAVQLKANQARRMSFMFREECKKEQALQIEKKTGMSLEKVKKILFDARITIILLVLFVTTKLPIAILQYAHYFHMRLPYSVRNCEFVGNICRFFFSIFTPFLFPLLNTTLKMKALDFLCNRVSRMADRKRKITVFSTLENTEKNGLKSRNSTVQNQQCQSEVAV